MIGTKQWGIRGRMLAALAGVLWLSAGRAARADLPLPHTATANSSNALLRLTNTNGGPSAFGFWGTGTYGFVGNSTVIGGAGVRGSFFDAATGAARASGNLGRSTGGGAYYGVWGRLFSGSPDGAAVYGLCESQEGAAGAFEVKNTASSANGLFVETNGRNEAIASFHRGVSGTAGLFVINNVQNTSPAVQATTVGAGPAVFGDNRGESGVAGRFRLLSPSTTATCLEALHHGRGDGLLSSHFGINGTAGLFSITNYVNPSPALVVATAGTGSAGRFAASLGNTVPCLEVNHSGQGDVVVAVQSGPIGNGGIFRIQDPDNPYYALYAETAGTGLACYCAGQSLVGGDLDVTGGLTPSAAGSLIDHPLDPANKYLYRSFVESPDMKNLCDGVVVLDANGQAWAQVPEWFEAANADFRYQLTAIGAPAPELHVAQEIQDNSFQIAGGSAGLKVSWQVTGIRQDPYALQHAVAVEADKPAEEVGRYRHPEAYGLPEEYRLEYASEYRADSTIDAGVGETIGSSVPEED